MKILVTYVSSTGNSFRYAQWIAWQLSADLEAFSGITPESMGKYDLVIYGAGIYAGTLNGLKKIRTRFPKSGAKHLILFATGGSPNTMVSNIEACWKNILGEDLPKIPHFYMQAGINYEKMGMLHKTMMKLMVSHLNRKKNQTEEEREAARIMASAYDIVDYSLARPLLEAVSRLQEEQPL